MCWLEQVGEVPARGHCQESASHYHCGLQHKYTHTHTYTPSYSQEVEGTMGELEFGPSLRRSIRRYFALAWEPPDGGCALQLINECDSCGWLDVLNARLASWRMYS